MTTGKERGSDRPLYFSEILCEELNRIFPELKMPASIPVTDADAQALEQSLKIKIDRDLPSPLAAICLSGGGIRSASFGLGALQALAQFGLLGQFHYLSTVSGGGYIGSWLSTWRYHAKDDNAVFKSLNLLQQTGREPEEISGIRADSNYLTPRLGLLSADTWTVVALYIRNFVLNWLVFGPFFMGVFFIPKIFATVLENVANFSSSGANILLTLGGAAIVGGLTVSNYGRFRTEGEWLTDKRFHILSVLPVLGGAVCFSIAAATRHVPNSSNGFQVRGALTGALVYALSWLGAHFLIRLSGRIAAQNPRELIVDILAWVAGGAIAGFFLFFGFHVASSGQIKAEYLAILGLSWPVISCLVGELLYVGFSSFSSRGDMDREWLARSAGWLSALSASWALTAALSLYGPQGLLFGWHWLLGVGGVSGFITIGLGASSKTLATTGWNAVKSLSLTHLVSVAAFIFALFLATILSLLDDQLDQRLGLSGAPWHEALAGGITVALCLIGLSVAVSWLVNINRFSLHAVYRNRLVRAFLGSARAHATPPRGKTADPFTGFDLKDNPPMTAMINADTSKPARLLHVINMALNVVSSRNLAWQERKAESFTVTPLSSGNPNVGYRKTGAYGGRRAGLTVGTAMAISGAAVSPNQGYHSSPLVGLLLTLFNVRLGWWLGNPRYRSYRREGPTFGLLPALEELAGATTDEGNWVYMSDGGHFENLGLYEMVRRRCRIIVISDAGSDPDCAFEDLGNAVRKAFVDMGVSINFEKLEIRARQDPPVTGVYCAVGCISYPGSDQPGWLIYVKPGYHGNEPADIRAYAQAHKTFPHETTTDQWFSESQLESYRALGAHVFEQILTSGEGVRPGHKPPQIDVKEIVRRVTAYLSTTRDTIDTG